MFLHHACVLPPLFWLEFAFNKDCEPVRATPMISISSCKDPEVPIMCISPNLDILENSVARPAISQVWSCHAFQFACSDVLWQFQTTLSSGSILSSLGVSKFLNHGYRAVFLNKLFFVCGSLGTSSMNHLVFTSTPRL